MGSQLTLRPPLMMLARNIPAWKFKNSTFFCQIRGEAMLFTYPCFLTDPPSWVEADPPAPNAPTFPEEEEEEEEEEPDCCRRSWAKTTAEKTITSVKANKAAKSLIFMMPVFGGFSSQLYVQRATKIQIHVSGQRNPSPSSERERTPPRIAAPVSHHSQFGVFFIA